MIDLATEKLVGGIIQHPREVIDLALSGDGELLVTACMDGNAHVHEVGEIQPEIMNVAEVKGLVSLQASGDGHWLAVVHDDGTSEIMDTEGWQIRGSISGMGGQAISLSQSGDRIAEPGGIWEFRNGKYSKTRDRKSRQLSAISPDSRMFLSASGDQIAM